MEHPLCATSDTTKRYDGTAIRYGEVRGEKRQEARRPCDVFVKRCRVGTKETRFSGCPRGSITGGGGGGSGRVVTDKRESYKMGCATGEQGGGRREGERGHNVREGRWCPSVPRRCGNPGDERANAILQLSRLRPGDEKSEMT